MIRKLLATTAIATLVASGAYAQTAPAPAAPVEQAAPEVVHAEGHLASNLIGETVYSSSGDDAENIGSVNDLVLSPEGDVQAIVVGVGGFLGIGQKNVALEYDLVEWTEREGEQWMVVSTNREALEALPEFDTAAYSPQPADAEVGNTEAASAEDLGSAESTAAAEEAAEETDDMAASEPASDMTETDDTMAAAPADDEAATTEEDSMAAAPAEDPAASDDMAAAPADETDAAAEEDSMAAAPADDTAATDETQTSAIDRSTLTDTPVDGMSADDFIGTTVYGANEENVGEIEDVILSSDGATVEGVIIDVGGFLGIGAKPVAVGMDNLAFMSDEDGENYLYTQFTEEQLEAQPEYDEATFAENRDDQLMMSPAE
ncbi:PRC-barrel domain-containing protein [Mesorhizobium sp. CAU 1741]|uniref:PRC-barrel domain-containing protein n=1 Tax=Mesorhizobium sp. CAU 1741 TaxID=3140366 RepID=UPI00325B9895